VRPGRESSTSTGAARARVEHQHRCAPGASRAPAPVRPGRESSTSTGAPRARVEHQHRCGPMLAGRERQDLEWCSAGAGPAFREHHRHLPRRRAGDAHVRVAPRVERGARRCAVLVADVHPAGERDVAVRDQDLAVVAVALVPEPREQRVEEPDVDAAVAQRSPERTPRRKRAEGVGEDAHRDTARRGCRQVGRELAPDLVVLEDVRLEQDLVARGENRVAHRREGVVAAEVRLDVRRGQQRGAVDAAQQVLEARIAHAPRQCRRDRRDVRRAQLRRQDVSDDRARDGTESPNGTRAAGARHRGNPSARAGAVR